MGLVTREDTPPVLYFHTFGLYLDSGSLHTTLSCVLFGTTVGGIACALGGLFIYMWLSRHSPYNPFGAIGSGGMEAYTLKEPFYTSILWVAAGLGLIGITLVASGLIDRAKRPSHEERTR